jgi:glycosyltransferase involved in cell wall biosynthesis
VVFTGFLPELRAGLAGTVAIVPIRIGSGLRMKLMQCAALGIPIVSTTIGAEGLEWRDKQDYLRADTPDEWIQAIGNLTGKPEAGADLARSAFQRLTETFDLTRCAEKRERVYLDATQLPRD